MIHRLELDDSQYYKARRTSKGLRRSSSNQDDDVLAILMKGGSYPNLLLHMKARIEHHDGNLHGASPTCGPYTRI